MADNEKRIRAAGLRMAMKLIPQDVLDQLTDVEPDRHEANACYLIAPDDTDGGLRIMLVTLDEQCSVSRVIKKTTFSELFRQILGEMKEM